MVKNVLIVLFISILISSCLLLRKKSMERMIANVNPEPEIFCSSVEAKIDGFIYVKAKIQNGVNEQRFIFDTGSPLVYSIKTKDSFNLAASKLFRFGANKYFYGKGSINFAGVNFKNVGFLVTDNGFMSYVKDCQGIIGSSILQTSICELNFADSSIKISNDIKNFKYIAGSYTCDFSLSESQGTPIVKLVIGSDTLGAFIDTGYSGSIKLSEKSKISEKDAERQELFKNSRYFGYPEKDYFFYTAFYRLKHLDMLGLALDSIVVSQDHEYYGRNLIGLSFLKRFIVTIDWIHHKIYLKPIKGTEYLKNIYTYGFTCLIQNKQIKVYEIYKGSELDRRGVKSGDVIRKINEIDRFSDSIVREINSNVPNSNLLNIEFEDNSKLTLKKYQIFK